MAGTILASPSSRLGGAARPSGGPEEGVYTWAVMLHRTPHHCLAMLLATLFLTACTGQRELAQENDRLRERVLELETQLRRTTRESAEARARLPRSESPSASARQDVQANTPYVAEITIGRMSHARDTDGDGEPDELLIYIEPVDGWGRFMQIVGTLSVHAAVLPTDADAQTIGRVQLDPGALRRAYRSSFTGSHYAVTVPITSTEGLDADGCVVYAEFADGSTGLRYVAERGIGLTPP